MRRKTLQLQKSLSDAGVKYTDGKNLFLIKGDEATLTTGKRMFENCKNDRRTAVWEHAKLNGVDFRAVGNEPGWVVEIYDTNDIVLITDYGQSRYEFADTEVSSATQMLTTIYQGSNAQNQIEITITARRCGDSMSGDMFPVTVDVRLNKTVYRGCGKALH